MQPMYTKTSWREIHLRQIKDSTVAVLDQLKKNIQPLPLPPNRDH